MSIYEKRAWLNDDAQNRAVYRQNLSGGFTPMVVEVTVSDDRVTMEATWQEIFDAMLSGIPVMIKSAVNVINTVCSIDSDSGSYKVFVVNQDSIFQFTAASADAKPVHIFG